MWRKTASPEINFNIGGEPEEPDGMSYEGFDTAWGEGGRHHDSVHPDWYPYLPERPEYDPVKAETELQIRRIQEMGMHYKRTLNDIKALPAATTEELHAAYPHARTDKLGSSWSSRYASETPDPSITGLPGTDGAPATAGTDIPDGVSPVRPSTSMPKPVAPTGKTRVPHNTGITNNKPRATRATASN
jgi:hypothetical protein